MTLRKRPDWISDDDWAAYVGGSKEPKSNGEKASEDTLAVRMAEVHAGSLVHATLLAKWFKLCEQGWEPEKTPLAFDLARNVCRAETVTSIGSKLVAGVLKMCAADPRIAVPPEIFDANPWILNTMTGAVELKTGQLRPHRPDDYCTKWAPIGPGGECPMFHEFMRTIFAGDIELVAFLQRFFGYVLTGLTDEHAMLFFYGTGANGKSVLLTTITGILGKYHKVAPIDTFTVTSTTQHPTDLAGLMGARLVTAIETEEGRRWAEAKIKALTGGDPITARFMRQDFFEYIPNFKLIVAGNHKPGLRSVDEAIRRRFHLVPFNVTIRPDKRDKHLANKLKSEWPGILQWMIDGCLKWQAGGLKPPKSVIDATNEYLQSEDLVSAWIEDRCECKASFKDTAARLFASWKAWAELNGEFVGSQKQFAEKLQSRGFERKAIGHKNARGFAGIMAIDAETARESIANDYWNK